MRTIPLVTMLALALAAGACDTPPDHGPRGRDSIWVGDALARAQADRAILVQAALFPHHFEPGSVDLSPVGLDAFGVLARNLAQTPRDLVLRRGAADRVLWAARVESIRARLTDAGVATSALTVRDGTPGGAGWTSDRIVETIESGDQALSEGTVGITTGTGDS